MIAHTQISTLTLTRRTFMRAGIEALLKRQLGTAEVMLVAAMNMTSASEALSHPDIGECLVHLGNLKMLQQQINSADSYYKLAAFVFGHAFGPHHVNVQEAIRKVASSKAQIEEKNHKPGRYLPVPYRDQAVVPVSQPILLKVAGSFKRGKCG